MKNLLFSLTFLFVATAAQAEVPTIAWADLVDPSAQDFEDPYLDLTYDQIDELVTVVRSRQMLELGTLTDAEKSEIEARLKAAEDTLAATGIDVDWLIDQRWVVAEKREAAANAGNPDLNEQEISIAGFAIPAPEDPDGVSAIYLVGAPGLCSHMPPPEPNQLLRVRLQDAWTPEFMHQPVKLTGRLQLAPSEQVFPIVDGDVVMKATWLLDADSVEDLKPAEDTPTVANDWVEQLRDKLKANGTISGD